MATESPKPESGAEEIATGETDDQEFESPEAASVGADSAESQPAPDGSINAI